MLSHRYGLHLLRRIHHSGKCFLTRRLHSISVEEGSWNVRFHEPAKCVKQEKAHGRKYLESDPRLQLQTGRTGLEEKFLGPAGAGAAVPPTASPIPKAWVLSVLHLLASRYAQASSRGFFRVSRPHCRPPKSFRLLLLHPRPQSWSHSGL